jgi:hypothetical protein
LIAKYYFNAINEENSFKIHVSKCNENGFWIGDHFKCKLDVITQKLLVQFLGQTNNFNSNKTYFFSIIITLFSTLVFVLIICAIIGSIIFMRRKKLTKKN